MLPRLHEIGVDGRLLALAMGLAVITALARRRDAGVQDVADRSRAGDELPRRRRTGRRPSRRYARPQRAGRGADGRGHDAARRRRPADQLLHPARARRPRLECVGAADVLSRHAAGLFDRAQGGADRHAAHRTAPPARRAEAWATPMPGRCSGSSTRVGVFVPPGRTPEEMRDNPDNPHIRAVSHDYLQTMGAPPGGRPLVRAERRCRRRRR